MAEPVLELQKFFPYRLAVLAEAVSLCTAQVYAQRFELTRDEWRVIAALAELGPTRTLVLAEYTTLGKMPMSRAVAALVERALVQRELDPADRRNHVLTLRPAGHALVRRITPMVLAREAFLYAGLTPAERKLLDGAMDKLLKRALQMQAL